METELKPCPFCGGPAGIFRFDADLFYPGCSTPMCHGCADVNFGGYPTEEAAIKAWARRAACPECATKAAVTLAAIKAVEGEA